MSNRLLDRQASLVAYLTSGTAIFAGPVAATTDQPRAGDSPRRFGIDPGLLHLEARYSHDKRMAKIKWVLPMTFDALGTDHDRLVREFTEACPPTGIGRLENARQFHDFLRARWQRQACAPPYLPDLAAFELAHAAVLAEDDMVADARAAAPARRGAIRRNPRAILLRCSYDIRPILEGGLGAGPVAHKDCRFAISLPPGAADPVILACSSELFAALEMFADFTDQDVVDDMLGSGELIAELDLAGLRRELELEEPELRDALWGRIPEGVPCFGIYGKLGETKGSFALLAAMKELKEAGLEVGLLAMAHGWPALESRFRDRTKELGLDDRVLQIPFLPHWRVPEFLRSCLAVCCLEQDFPIVFHTPAIAREVLMCGACLIASTEMIRKLPDHERLPDGYGCVAIPDVQDIAALSARLAAVVRDPEPVAAVTARGQAFARALQADARDCEKLERLLKMAANKRRPSKKGRSPAGGTSPATNPNFPLTHAAARLLEETHTIRAGDQAQAFAGTPIDLPQARNVLAAVEQAIKRGDSGLRQAAATIRLEIAIAEAENDTSAGPTGELDPLFRLRAKRWAMIDDDLPRLVRVRDPQLRVRTFDASDLTDGEPVQGNPAGPHQRHVVAFAQTDGIRRNPFFVGEGTARVLQLSDGTRTALEIATDIEARKPDEVGRRGLQYIEELFVAGLLWLQEERIDSSEAVRANHLNVDRRTLAFEHAASLGAVVAQRGEEKS